MKRAKKIRNAAFVALAIAAVLMIVLQWQGVLGYGGVALWMVALVVAGLAVWVWYENADE